MDTRRSIADRVIARARARGTPIDKDLDYMAIVELWVEGAIDDKGMRQHYIERSRTPAGEPEKHRGRRFHSTPPARRRCRDG
jgi:hypothetical protein